MHFFTFGICINRIFKVEHISETCLTVKHSHYPSIYFLSHLFLEPCKVFFTREFGAMFLSGQFAITQKMLFTTVSSSKDFDAF